MNLISFDAHMQVGHYRGYSVIPGYLEGRQQAIQITEDPNNTDVSKLVEIALRGKKNSGCLREPVIGVLVDKDYPLAGLLEQELSKHDLKVVLRHY